MQNIFILEDQNEGLALVKQLVHSVFGNTKGYSPTIRHKKRIKNVIHKDLAECDIAFIDLSLPDGYSFNIITECKDINPNVPVIVTTLYSEDDLVFNALQSGADGYLLKDDGEEVLTRCLKRILDGEPPISPQIARKLMGHFSSDKKIAQDAPLAPWKDAPPINETLDTLTQLTKREKQVLVLITQGLVTKEIARELGLSGYTINDIVKSFYKKLNINSRIQAANLAIKSGLV